MIKDIKAREILDSRGNPTVEVSLSTEKGEFVSSVPSGASTGMHEAKELRDNDDRYVGKGVLRAVQTVNEKIKPLIIGKEVEPSVIDKIMIEADGTKDKSGFGSNSILGVSMSVFRAAAKEKNIPLFDFLSFFSRLEKNIPTPCFNIINGGVHSGGGVSFQEFMIVPSERSFKENLRSAVEFNYELGKNIAEKYGKESTNIGDEGGFVPKAESEKEILRLLERTGEKTSIIIDVAATEFFKEGKYFLGKEKKDRKEMIAFHKEIVSAFPIIGIEDPLEENDFSGWKELREEVGKVMVIGDDLLVTNVERMELAKKFDSCNAMILKINQIGSISEAVEAAKKAKEFGWDIIVSHRSGETNDDFIADFAVGIGASYIKSGAPKRGERVAKYNRLLKIEEDILKINQ